jgi:hypothetical protein
MKLEGDDAAKLESLHVAASGIAAATTRAEVYETAVTTAEDVLDFDVCGVFVHREGELVPVTQTESTAPLEPYGDTQGVLGRTFQTGESTLVREATTHSYAEPGPNNSSRGCPSRSGRRACYRPSRHSRGTTTRRIWNWRSCWRSTSRRR